MKFIKKNYRYFIIFIISVIINFLFISHFYDGPTQYGMAYAIARGEIPYVDFNTVATPLYPFIHSIFLLIYNSYLTFTIINSIITVLIFYFADKILPRNHLTYYLACIIPFFDVICPSYNLLSKLLIMIIIFLEKEKKNDYLLGVFLGLLFLTRHSVACFVILFSLLYCFFYKKDLKGCFKRIISIIIICVIFLIYLLCTNSLYEFIDLCFLGLFDFGHKNKVISSFCVGSFIVMFLCYIYDIIRGKSDDKYLSFYGLASLSFMIPIMDFNHFSCTFLFFILLLFVRFDLELNYKLFNGFLILMMIFFTNFYCKKDYPSFHVYSFNHFPIYVSNKDDYYKVLDYYGKKYSPSVMIDHKGVIYDIALDREFTYFDIPLTGNYGLKGTENMKQKLVKGTYYYIDRRFNTDTCSQLDVELCKYIIKNSTLVDSVGIYSVYYYEGEDYEKE